MASSGQDLKPSMQDSLSSFLSGSMIWLWLGCLMAWMVKNLPAVQEIPWRRKWQPTAVFLPGEFHGQRSLVGYSPWGRKESDTTERLHLHFHSYYHSPTHYSWAETALGLKVLLRPLHAPRGRRMCRSDWSEVGHCLGHSHKWAVSVPGR